MKKKKNIALIVGIVISLLLLLLVLYYDSIIPVDSYSIDKGAEGYIYDEFFKIEHPLPPNDFDKLGTDPLGRNVFSMLIVGAKTTLGVGFLAALFKLAVALPIVYWRKESISDKLIRFFSKGCNIVVEIIIAFFVLNLNWYKQLNLKSAIVIYALILGVIGWGRLAKSLKNKDNVVPRVIANYFIEVSRVLIIQCVLGLAGITVGINKFADIKTKWGYIPNYNPEWGGMLATAGKAITSKSYWLILGPSIFFAISIIGFMLLGKGILYDVEEDKYAKLRKIGLFFSPKEFMNQCNNLGRYWESVVFKSFVAILIVCIVVSQFHTSKYQNRYQMDIDNIYNHIEEFSKSEYEGRLTGTTERDNAANYIADELKRCNITPLFEDKYIQEFDVDGGVKGKNIGGYMWGRNSNNPLVIVTSYDYLGNDSKGLYKNGTSVSAILELARNLREKSKDDMNTRTIVFLFTDGSEQNGQGINNVVGNEHVDVNSFYVYLSYLGIGNSEKVYMDTSTVSSAYNIFYDNIKVLRTRGKELDIPIKQEYLYPAFEDVQTFMEKQVCGVVISSVNKEDIFNYYKDKKQNDFSKIDKDKLKEQSQLLLDFAVDYAWRNYWGERGLKVSN